MKIQTEKDMRQIQLNEKIELSRAADSGKAAKSDKALAFSQSAEGKNTAALNGAANGAGSQEKALALSENIEKAERLKAGMALIDGTKKLEQVRAEEEAKEDSGDSGKSEEDDSEKVDKDSVLLSKLSKLLSGSAKDKAYLWTLEMEMQLWEMLLKWGPFGKGEDAGQNLQELSRIYQLLLKAIMENTEGDNRALQLARLNQGLSMALNRLTDSSLNELFNFLEQYEGGRAPADARASLYYHVTGRTLSAKEANAFWNAGSRGAVGSADGRGIQAALHSRFDAGGTEKAAVQGRQRGADSQGRAAGQTAQRGSYGAPVQGQGYIKRPRQGGLASGQSDGVRGFGTSERGGLAVDGRTHTAAGSNTAAGAAQRGRSAYLSSMKSGEEAAFMAAGRGEQAGVFATGGAKGRASYSVTDLQKAENFVKYLEQGGDLFKNREISAENEEILGCLCADLEMKSQLFSDGFRLGDRMKTTVRSAVGNMIDCYLKEAEHRIQARQDVCPMSRREVYRVYYYILKQYQMKRDPALVIDEGLLYASNLFEEKKKEESFRHAQRYAREAGFFGAGSAREEERTGKKKGRRFFSDSWSQFRHLAERYGISYQEFLQTSPWGMNVSPEALRGKNNLGKTMAAFALAAGAVAAFVWINYIFR